MSEKPEECQCCHFETEALTLFAARGRRAPVWYCDLCSGSIASTVKDFDQGGPGTAQIVSTICYVGNAILAAIKELHDQQPREERT